MAEEKNEFQRETLIPACRGLTLSDQRKQTIRRHSYQKLKKYHKEKDERKENVSILNNSSEILH